MCNDQMCSNYQKNKLKNNNKKTSLVTTPPEYSHLQSSTQKGFLWSDPRCFFREPSSNRREIGWSDCSELEACDVDDHMVDPLVPYSHTVLMY